MYVCVSAYLDCGKLVSHFSHSERIKYQCTRVLSECGNMRVVPCVLVMFICVAIADEV